MPVLERDDAEIYFEEYGDGFPVLLLSPGGMRSNMSRWRSIQGEPPRPYQIWAEVLSDHFHVVAMDQRNAGRSKGAVAADHGWHTYADDQLALMDHLGCERFLAVGASIGGSFGLMLCRVAPTRLVSAVLQNPLGFTEESPTHFLDAFDEWAEELVAKRPKLDVAAISALRQNMWSGDFVFSVDRAFTKTVNTPLLICPGNDIPHPTAVSEVLAENIPGAEYLPEWRCPDFADAQRDAVIAFLQKHAD